MNPRQSDIRDLAALWAAIAITFVLIALNLSIHFSRGIFNFFSSLTGIPILTSLINFLVLWLAVLLWVALRRWRQIYQRNVDLEAVISSISPDALVVIGPDRTIRMCNESVERLFGLKADEVIGQKTDVLYFDRRKNPTRKREIYDILAREGFHYGTATGKRKDGGTVPLEIISGELVGSSGVVLLIRDITERQAVEEERRRLEARALQSQKLESLGILAGGIAHDFNNLLMIIQGHADLARMQIEDNPPVVESLTEILKGTARARELCRHLLSFAGRAPRDIKAVDLARVTRDAGKLLDVRIPSAITLDYDIAEALPPVQGDDSQLHQVVMNLITNACDAIGDRPGRVCVSAGARAFDRRDLADSTVESEAAPGVYAFVSVSDTGCGMDEETRRKIFEPFFTTKHSGHGMGMAAVLGIVRSHDGFIKVDSKFGEGSTITILLPLRGDGMPAPAEAG